MRSIAKSGDRWMSLRADRCPRSFCLHHRAGRCGESGLPLRILTMARHHRQGIAAVAASRPKAFLRRGAFTGGWSTKSQVQHHPLVADSRDRIRRRATAPSRCPLRFHAGISSHPRSTLKHLNRGLTFSFGFLLMLRMCLRE